MLCCLTEKGNQVDPYAKALGTPHKKDGVVIVQSELLNDEVHFVHAQGHLFQQYQPQEYNPAWADRNDYSQLPLLPKQFEVKPQNKWANQQFQLIKKEVMAADGVILATDADNQGENIGREILERIPGGLDKLKYRLLNSSLTAVGARNSFENHLVDPATTAAKGAAGKLQNEINWLYGMNMSRVAMHQLRERGYRFPVSAGTVQTPLLTLVVENDRDIRDFKSHRFWLLGLEDEANHIKFHHINNHHFNSADEAKNAAQGVNSAVVKEVEAKDKVKTPPALFSLGDLQAYAADKWGYSSKSVLETMQHLYDELHVTSYPRTESEVIEREEFDYLKAGYQGYMGLLDKDWPLSNPEPREKVVVADAGGHPALIPTDKLADLSTLKPKEKNLYLAVVERTMLMFAADQTYATQTVKLADTTGEEFVAKGKQIQVAGWTELVHQKPTKDVILPVYEEGQVVPVKPVITDDVTKKPTRITESKIIKQLAPKYSLGTPATQAGILDELITKRKYIEVKGKKRELYPTDAGRITVDFWQGTTLTDLKSAKAWQDVFKRVEKGDIQAEAYLKKIKQLLTNQVEVYRTKQPEISIAPPERADYATQLFMPELVCPKCHKGKVGLVTRTANSGTKEWYGCDNPKCKFSLPKVFFSQALDEPLIRELCQLGKTKVFADLVDSKQRHYRNKVYFQLEPKSKKLTPKFT